MPVAIDGILETALYVDDLDEADSFYGTILGLPRITRQGDRHVFFRCGPGVLLIFNRAETVKPAPAGSLAGAIPRDSRKRTCMLSRRCRPA